MRKLSSACVLLFAVITLNLFVCDSATSTAEAAQAAQTNFLSRLAGKWMLESESLGSGFIGSTFPTDVSPPHEVKLSWYFDLPVEL